MTPTDPLSTLKGKLTKARDPGTCENDDSEPLLLFLNALHAHLPEDERPSAWAHFSDDQRARVQAAYRAMFASRAWADVDAALEAVEGEMARLRARGEGPACLTALAANEPCAPDETLKRCTICGFVVDTKYAADFSPDGRALQDQAHAE